MRLIAPLLLLLLLMFAGAASAGTDYYMSPSGNNASAGTSLATAWANLSHAQTVLSAGDTLWIVNGTYTNDTFMAQTNGTNANWIAIKAYNGTPTFVEAGTVRTLKCFNFHDTNVAANAPGPISYYSISGLRFENYGRAIDICYGSAHFNISDIKTDQCSTGFFAGPNCHDVATSNMQINGSHWNGWYIWHDNYNITATGVHVTNQIEHSFFDLHTNNDNITLINCRAIASDDNAPGVYMGHGDYGTDDDVTIINFTYADVPKENAINAWNPGDNLYVDTLSCTGSKGIQFYGTGTNLTLKNIYVRVADGVLAHGIYFGSVSDIDEILLENVTVENVNTAAYYYDFKFESGFDVTKNVTMRDLYGDNENYIVMVGTGTPVGSHVLEYSDGTVFSGQPGDSIQYYPSKSNLTWDKTSVTVTYYNITLNPTNAYLKNVTMSHESDAADDRTNITVNSSVTSNPTWINATMQNTSNTYNVSIDGGYVTQVVSDSGGVVQYNYTSSWSPHTFEFDWSSDAGFSGAPDPTNIANTTGETWVRHSWSAGSGNITDSYNVSVNSVWHNITNAYYNNTGLAAETWSNITVWAYNNTGGISQNSISQNTQSDAAAWAPSNTSMYYNTTSTITITTKTDGTNIFSRTPTEVDGNATSGRMVVRTS